MKMVNTKESYMKQNNSNNDKAMCRISPAIV